MVCCMIHRRTRFVHCVNKFAAPMNLAPVTEMVSSMGLIPDVVAVRSTLMDCLHFAWCLWSAPSCLEYLPPSPPQDIDGATLASREAMEMAPCSSGPLSRGHLSTCGTNRSLVSKSVVHGDFSYCLVVLTTKTGCLHCSQS